MSHYATNGHAEKQRQEKARALATWCWAHGVDAAALSGLDDAARRHVAREAKVNPPSSWATWAVVVAKLEMAAQRPEMGRQFGVAETPEWLSGTAGTTETPLPKNISSADADMDTPGPRGAAPEPLKGRGAHHLTDADLAEAMRRHPSGSARGTFGPDGVALPPRGWPELVASGHLLGHGRACGVDRCGKPAIATTMTVYRCAEHPPKPGEWGAGLDWKPRTLACAPNRCYCGRCASHRLVPVSSIVELVPRDDQETRGDARKGAAKARQAARAGRGSR